MYVYIYIYTTYIYIYVLRSRPRLRISPTSSRWCCDRKGFGCSSAGGASDALPPGKKDYCLMVYYNTMSCTTVDYVMV